LSKKVFKSAHLPPESSRVLIDGKTVLLRGKSVLETLEQRVLKAQKTLTRLQKEIDQRSSEAKSAAENILREASQRAKKIVEDAKAEAAALKDKVMAHAKEEGRREGEETGFKQGADEARRLVTRIQEILHEAKVKRDQIIRGSERDMLELVLEVAKKVVKREIMQDEKIVINNIRAALQKISGKEEITIRVNMADLNLTQKHKNEFLNEVKGLRNIRFVEDSSIERGGCRIDTDFGSVDAQISTQVEELGKHLLKAAEEG
jgi:flagellar assembly protein FliH